MSFLTSAYSWLASMKMRSKSLGRWGAASSEVVRRMVVKGSSLKWERTVW